MIGIGITTRNRILVFESSIHNFINYAPKNCAISICDDNSDGELRSSNEKHVNRLKLERPDIKVKYHWNIERHGIAKSKNRCLYELKNFDCEHFFLFDDDCWPKKEGWADIYINCAKAHGTHHLLYTFTSGGFPAFFSRNAVRGSGTTALHGFSNCAGVLLYIDKEALDRIGGYDSRFLIYGYEHVQMTYRLYRAGMCGDVMYGSPALAPEYIFSYDESLGHLFTEAGVVQPPSDGTGTCSCMTSEEAKRYSAQNAPLLNGAPTHIPLAVFP